MSTEKKQPSKKKDVGTKSKRNRRNQSEFPGLDPKLNLKTRSDLVDYDYIDKLNHEEKDWLNRFTEEYVSGKYDHNGERIHAFEEVPAKKGKNKLVDRYKNKAETANNKRNVDIYTTKKAESRLAFFSELLEDEEPVDPYWEEKLIHEIDIILENTKKKT